MERSQIPKYIMSTLCRICSEKSSKLTPIFESESLLTKIYKCLPIQVKESDYLPLKICESCFFKINESYTLYIKADEADQRLRKLWKILLKETMTDNSEVASFEEKTMAVLNNYRPFASQEGEIQGELSPSSLVINIPEEINNQSVDIFGNNDQLVSGLPNEVMVISKAVSFEIISESLILKSPEKNNEPFISRGTQQKILRNSEKISENEEPEPPGKFYQCQFCPYQLSSLASLRLHESSHSDERPYLCDICGKSFKQAKHLRSHTRTHLSVRKKCICKICDKGFLTNFFLQEHMNTHTGETPYKCQLCEKEFREKIHLRQHKWTHSAQKFVCPICNSNFNRKGNMREHMKQYHKNGTLVKLKINRKAPEGDSSYYKIFKCPACTCEFPNQDLLKSHLNIHPEQKKFSCSLCGKKFRHSGSLTYHRRAAHTGERPFQCNFCDQKFSLRSVQKIHERKNHTFEHPFKCKFCSRPFTNSSSLKNHLYVHAKEKMFKCEECGKKFSRSSSLSVHKKLHSGDRKFTCDQCGKNYIQKHDLLKHRKFHDPKSKPFFCKYCGNSFSYKKDSVKHAMCQFDFFRKNNLDIYAAEKILDSVTNSLEKVERDFSVEEEQQLLLESVKEFSGEKATVIYENAGEFEFCGDVAQVSSN